MARNKDKSKEQEKIYLAGRLRRLLLKSDREDLQALRESGLLDKEAIEVLESMKRGLGEGYLKTRQAENIIHNQLSHSINTAVQEGKGDLLSHIVGEETSKADISSIELIRRLKKHVTTVGRTWQFKGEVNSGKTNLAVVIAELWQEETKGKVLTNMESLEHSETVKTFSQLERRAEELDRFLFIGEDFSNHASGYASDLKNVQEKARQFTNELAKLGGNAIFLGHTGMDIHKDLRRKAYFVDNPTRKKAVIYEDSKNGHGQNKVMTLNGIPKASWSYNPNERTEFYWQVEDTDNTDQKRKEAIIEEIADRLKTQKSVKTVEIPYTNSKVAEVMRELARNNKEIMRFNESKSPKELQRKN